jgi:hypothetical protein
VTAVPRRDPATACRSLGGHDLAVTAVTAVIVGTRISRAVTAVITAPAATAVTRRAFVTRPGGGGDHRGRRDRRDRGDGIPLGFAVAAVTTVAVELRPARALIWWGEGLSCRRKRHDRGIFVLGAHFAPWPKVVVTAAGAARRARRARRVGRDQHDPARPLKGGPGLIGREARNRGDHLVSAAHLAAA